MDKSQATREARLLAEGREVMLDQIMSAERDGKVSQLPYQNYLLRQVVEDLAERFKADCKRGSGAGAYKKFATYVGHLEPKMAALRAAQAVLEALFKGGAADIPQPVYAPAAYAAGKAIYSEYLMRHFKKLNPQIFNSLVREYDKSMTSDERHMLKAFKMKFDKEGYEFPVWDFADLEGMGYYIMGTLVDLGFIESWTKTERVGGRAKAIRYCCLSEELRTSSLEIVAMVAEAPRIAGALIEKPLEWDHNTNGGGGYHTPEMRRLMPYAFQGIGPKPIAPMVAQVINILQGREWQINSEVLDVVRATSLKRDFGDVVSPDPGPWPEYPEGCNEREKKVWKGQARRWYTEKKTRAVKHKRAQKVFRDASELRHYPMIWFAWYADFRGRYYARSQSVSPQGNDLEKGLLRLAHGRPLSSPRAVYWFKVHGANKWGLDKEELDDRAAWVEKNHAWLVQMGSDPAAHLEWTEADSPVQFLAWVMEYARAFGTSVPSIGSGTMQPSSSFVSHLTMGQDGTCNGLQNFSALLRDSVGGKAVNLLDAPKPQDIYSDVAVRSTQLLQSAPPSIHRDSWLAHGLNRKVTKRTTMTLPYGCTRFSCSTFINDDYLMAVHPKEINPEDYGDAANYLSHIIWAALDDIVVKAREVMEWLRGWAKHCCDNGIRIEWTAPTGQTIVSEYERMATVKLKSAAFKCRLTLYKPEEGKPDAKKSSNAVAPNFVHSLDASHLSLVVVAADAAGMEVVTIHDEFGVHAADTEQFHFIIRDQFVKMYEDLDILQEMATRTGYETPVPSKGTLDLQDIYRSRNFFG